MREVIAAFVVWVAVTALMVMMVTLPAAAADSPACVIKRDADGRIHRSERVRRNFQRLHPCPSTGRTAGACPGYVKDHVVPLCACGADSVANMQWQTVADSKAKDRLERAQCRGRGDGD